METVKFLFIIAVISVISAMVVLVYVFSGFTGYSITSTGTANLTVETQTMINFTTNSINWGSGKVTAGNTNATLDSEGHVLRGNWTAVSAPLILENIGNDNVTLDLQAGKTAATFIGGTNPSYMWKVNNTEANSCNGGETKNAYVVVNTSAAGTYCLNFSSLNASNAIAININITIPQDSLKGALGDTITATATAQ